MNLFQDHQLNLTRRQLFGRTALGVGTAAMAQMLGPDLLAETVNTGGGLHHRAKAKRVIYLFMSGGPSQHDMWDYKPKMREMFGKDLPEEVRDGQRITGMTSKQKNLPLCPSKYEFTKYDNNDQGVTRKDRRAQLDALAALNNAQHERFADPDVLARIKQHEMAYRMQTSVPELMDLSRERDDVFALYGEEARQPGTFAACCLNARRLAERGVRNIQIFHRGWDAHNNLPKEHESQCKDVDQACAALITDLKQRGMLDDTLVVWGGEFGRTAYCQGKLTDKNYGRDHHPRCFTTWLAGGGVKPGITYGKTDDYGYNIVQANGETMFPQPQKDKWTPGTMHIHDLNATILHLLGIDHRKLTCRYQGRDFRLTDIHGHVIQDLLT